MRRSACASRALRRRFSRRVRSTRRPFPRASPLLPQRRQRRASFTQQTRPHRWWRVRARPLPDHRWPIVLHGLFLCNLLYENDAQTPCCCATLTCRVVQRPLAVTMDGPKELGCKGEFPQDIKQSRLTRMPILGAHVSRSHMAQHRTHTLASRSGRLACSLYSEKCQGGRIGRKGMGGKNAK